MDSACVAFPSHFSTHQPEPEASLIIPAFRLANMWNFADLRAYLMPLAEKVLGDVDKIVFAREFQVDKWITPAYINLCRRTEPINSEEAAKIGLDGVLLISRTREEWYTSFQGARCRSCNSGTSNRGCNSCGKYWSLGDMPDTHIGEKIDTWVKNGSVFATAT